MVDERPEEPTEGEGDPHQSEAADSAQLVEGDDEGLVDTEGDAAVPSEEDAGVAELAAELEAAKDAKLGDAPPLEAKQCIAHTVKMISTLVAANSPPKDGRLHLSRKS